MKLETCREAAREYSAKASELTRTLCYSAIAVIWVFRTEGTDGAKLPAELYAPGFFVVLALGLDLLHYVSGAVVWAGLARVKELRGVAEEAEFKAPRQLNWFGNGAFVSKLLAVAIAYILLLQYLVSRFA